MAKVITTPSGRKLTLPPENRVTFAEFGQVPRGDPRLVDIPSSGSQQKLHWVAAEQLEKMSAAAAADGFEILIASGWRPQLWATRAAYERDMIKQYGSVRAGAGKRAYKSGHQSGLVVDFGSGGLRPITRTHKQQQDTPFFAWLVENAGRFGWTNYHGEAFHWELRIPVELHRTGPGGAEISDYSIGEGGLWETVKKWSPVIAVAGLGLVGLGALVRRNQ